MRKATALVLVVVLVLAAFVGYMYLREKKKEKSENQLPTAEAGNDRTVNVSDIVQFKGVGYDPDGSVVLYEWDFDGDGNYDWNDPATGLTTHIYDAAGTYTAVLRVTDNKGGKATDTVAIVVVPNLPPVANFTYTPQNPTDLDLIHFTDTSTDLDGSVSSWYWDFGDGNTSSEQNPTHQYMDNGTYSVNLTVWDNDNESTNKSMLITVLNVPPVAGFDYSPGLPTTLDIINFTDLSYDLDGDIVSQYWDFGDGNTSSEQNPSHKYTLPGNRTVNLTVTDNDGATNTCSLMVNVSQPTIEIVLEGTDSQIYESMNLYWPLGNATSNATAIHIDAHLTISCAYPTTVEVTSYNISSEPYGFWLVSLSPPDFDLPPGNQSITFSVNITPQNVSIASPEDVPDVWVAVTFGMQVGVSTTGTPSYYAQQALLEEEYSLPVVWEFTNSTDYDIDGIPDAAEICLGLHPANSSDALLDPDNDGLDNLQEYLNGTDLYDDDTDGDQLGDGFELTFSKTDPTDWDTDNDGIGDGLEFIQNQGYSGGMQTLPDGWIGMTISTPNYTMYAETNSSVLEGKYDKDKKTLRIKVHGPPDTVGVVNITVPKAMVDSEKDIKTQVDGYLINCTLSQNSTHYFIHIEYTHSTHELAARFTPIPEITLNEPVNPTGESLSLSWDACTDPGFAEYEIYQSTVSGMLGSLIHTITDPDTVSYIVKDLYPGIVYYFTVRVVYDDTFYANSGQVFEKTLFAVRELTVMVSGVEVNVVYNCTGCLSVGNATQDELAVPVGEIPSGKKYINVFINISTTGTLYDAFITIHYRDSDVAGIDESRLRMYCYLSPGEYDPGEYDPGEFSPGEYDPGEYSGWAMIKNSGVWTSNNTVWARVTHLTVFAPMAEKTAAEGKPWSVSLLSYLIIFAIAIVLVGAGLGVKKMKKQKPVTVECQECGETIDVTGLERPIEIVCPKCGAKGTLESADENGNNNSSEDNDRE